MAVTAEKPVGDIERLEQRAHELAMQAGAKAAEQAGVLLARHTELVNTDAATRIEAEEFNRSYAAARIARESGHLNDAHSTAPGITIMMTKEGLEGAKETAGGDSDYMAEYLDSVEDVGIATEVYALRLPRGSYYMSMGATFFGEATAEDLPLGGENQFEFPTDAIIRVEGDNGELWQNQGFNPDGTPR